jgi:hypothetical protein
MMRNTQGNNEDMKKREREREKETSGNLTKNMRNFRVINRNSANGNMNLSFQIVIVKTISRGPKKERRTFKRLQMKRTKMGSFGTTSGMIYL